MPNLKENQLIFEAYRSINEDRYELRTTRDGYAIIDHSIRGPNNVLARFDRDERNEAMARYNHYTKQLSPKEIRAGFDKIRAGFNESDEQLVQCTKCHRAYSVDSLIKQRMSTTKCPHCQSLMKPVQGPHMHESSQISSAELEMAASIWPKSSFASEEAWLAYVQKWWPKLPSLVTALDKAKKIRGEASRGLASDKGEWQEVSGDTIKGNKDVQQDVFDIIKAAYGPMGGHPDFATIDNVPGDNNKVDVVDTDEPDDVDAAILSKTTNFGTKITTFASDGGTEAKRAAIAKTIDLLNTPGNYVEASGKLMDILIAKGAPTVDDEDTVRALLKGKEIMWHGDGVYSREIGGKPYTKKMLGKPSI